VQFYTKFSTLRNNEFYITGESYAGIYIPYLANKILSMNKLPETMIKMNLKGIMINNACTDSRECFEPGNDVNLGIYQYENLYIHGYYTEEEYNQITGACMLGYHSTACASVRKVMDAKFYNTNSSMLNLYAKCLYQKVSNPEGKKHIRLPHGKVPLNEDNVICEDMYGIIQFFNSPSIQEKLHVNIQKFEPCSDDVANNYTMFENASYWLYPVLMKEQLRIWITEGDVDNSVPITGTIAWLTRLRDEFGIPMEEQWREWWVKGLHAHEDQVAGMTWKLRGLTFASVKGAGHMMPKDKRREAATLLESFIQNHSLPENPNDV
jgi:carboxypeptidase C (cathepsin A)